MSDGADNGGTTSTEYRWKYLASTMTGLLFSSLVVLLIGAGVGIITLTSISQAWFVVYSLLLLAAGTWLYSVDILDAWKR